MGAKCSPKEHWFVNSYEASQIESQESHSGWLFYFRILVSLSYLKTVLFIMIPSLWYETMEVETTNTIQWSSWPNISSLWNSMGVFEHVDVTIIMPMKMCLIYLNHGRLIPPLLGNLDTGRLVLPRLWTAYTTSLKYPKIVRFPAKFRNVITLSNFNCQFVSTIDLYSNHYHHQPSLYWSSIIILTFINQQSPISIIIKITT